MSFLGDCRYRQGSLLAQMRELGFEIQQHARAEVLIEETIKTAEIEGERLDSNAVHSSVARQLGLPSAGLAAIRDQQADGMVKILLDATLNYEKPLTAERLFGWHAEANKHAAETVTAPFYSFQMRFRLVLSQRMYP